MSELKPCPCGGEAALTHGGSKNAFSTEDYSYVYCKTCRAETERFIKSFSVSSDEQAIEAWNRRVDNG